MSRACRISRNKTFIYSA